MSGPAGSEVTITGEGFGRGVQVWFGTLALPVLRRMGHQQLIVQIPAGAKGRESLVVEDDGLKVASLQPFQVIEPPPPAPPPAPPADPNHPPHEHAHEHPHPTHDHHHHPHAHPHRPGKDHHHPY